MGRSWRCHPQYPAPHLCGSGALVLAQAAVHMHRLLEQQTHMGVGHGLRTVVWCGVCEGVLE